MDSDQAEGPGNQGLALGDELRQEGAVEDAHLGVEHVAEQAFHEPVGARAALACRGRDGGAGAQQQVQAKPAEVGAAAVLEQGVGQFRDCQQRAQAEGHGGAPEQAADVDAQGGTPGLGATFDGGGAQYQGGIQARREGEQSGGQGEGEQVVDEGHGGTRFGGGRRNGSTGWQQGWT